MRDGGSPGDKSLVVLAIHKGGFPGNGASAGNFPTGLAPKAL